MNAFDYAMELEKKGEDYYRQLAVKCPNEGVKKILVWLADEEVRHFNIFKQMKAGIPEVPKSHVLDNVKDVFTKMKEEGVAERIEASQIGAYRKALDIEKMTHDFYMKKAIEVENEKQKEIFLKIADEENTHYKIIDSIIDFISAPERYLENAEFYHIGPYL